MFIKILVIRNSQMYTSYSLGLDLTIFLPQNYTYASKVVHIDEESNGGFL